MANKFKPKYVEFKGDHPYFVSGQSYTYREYSDWTQENCLDGGVINSTIKGRLYGEQYCTPKHLAGKREFVFASPTATKGFNAERRAQIQNQSRLENPSERLSGKWLKVKL